MPYPVLPPEPPPVINYLPPEDHSSSASFSETAASDVALESAVSASSEAASSFVVETLTTPTPPESFALESSASVEPAIAASVEPPVEVVDEATATTSAADLGAPISVGVNTDIATSAPPAPQPAEIVAATVAPAQRPRYTPSVEFQRAQAPSPSLPTLEPATPAVPDSTSPAPSAPTQPPKIPARSPQLPAPIQSQPVTPKTQPEPDSVSPDQPTLVIPETPPTPAPTPPTTQPGLTTTPNGSAEVAPETGGVIELLADRQEYDDQRQVFTAEGNVLMRFRGAVLDTNRLLVNIPNRLAVAEGNVALTRGEQVLRGERFEYNFVQNTGTIANARGEIFLPSAQTDFSPTLPTDVSAGVEARPPSDRITANQPLQNISSPGGINIGTGVGQDAPTAASGGTVRRLRFEASQIEFDPRGWQAQDVRITNDPFSPPELEIRADEASLTRLSPLRDEVRAKRARLVFDQGFSLPLMRSRVLLDRRQRDPSLFQFGYDQGDRGGLFVQSNFEPISTEAVQLSVTPQFFIQKALTDSNGAIFDPSVYGLRAKLNATVSPKATLLGTANFTSLDPSEISETLRANLQFRQLVGTHTLAADYSYRERLFNGSLGYQNVRSSLGAFLISPVIPLGTSGVSLSYQAGAQYVTADTDRLDLLEPGQSNNRVSLGRFEASAALNKGFLLWQGKGLPPTPQEGLRFTPSPVVPYLQLITGVRGVANAYTSSDTQTNLTGTIGLQGQVGQFSRSFLDYTGFNVSYSQSLINGQSPFLFDRVVDDSVLSAGIVQQLYGPFRVGFQTAINLDTGKSLSTDYTLEYSRRTYGVTVRYNPVLELGSIGLRVSDFNWNGGSAPFAGSGINMVEGGVVRPNTD